MPLVSSPGVRRGAAILITIAALALGALSLGAPRGAARLAVDVEPLALLSLLIAGIVLWFAGRTVGAVAATLAGSALAGLTWTIDSVNSADALHGIGLIVAPLLVPALVVLIADLPVSWRPVRPRSTVPTIAFLGIGVVGMARALVYEPLLDLDCRPFCGHSPVLVTPNLELAAGLAIVASLTTVVVCAVCSERVLRQLVSHPVRRILPAVAGVLLATGMAAMAGSATMSLSELALPGRSAEAMIAGLRVAACGAVGIGALIVSAERLAIRRSLAHVARVVGMEVDPLTLQDILGRAVGDPGLRVGYWTDDGEYVGADGSRIDLSDGSGTRRTDLTSRGRPVAVLLHDDWALPSDLLDQSLGPQARLAIQNESLQLELARRVDELCASRRRIVEVSDAERRDLERDLHDGAQQLLLAL